MKPYARIDAKKTGELPTKTQKAAARMGQNVGSCEEVPIDRHKPSSKAAKEARPVVCGQPVQNTAQSTTRVHDLPVDASARKAIPLYSGLVKYFPKALAAVAEVSRIGGEQHHPGEPLHWDRNKSTDEHDAMLRHLWEAGTVDVDGCRHSAKLAWRALSALEKELES